MTGRHGRFPLLALFALLAGCSSAPAPKAAVPADPAKPSRGLEIETYDGTFRDSAALAAALKALPATVHRAETAVRERLGLVLDPERPCRLSISDRVETVDVTTRAVGNRWVQVIRIPAAPIAQGRREPEDAVMEAVATAAVSGAREDDLPDWYRKGAPLWFSGEWDRRLHARVLDADPPPTDPGALVPGVDLAGRGNDPTACALFFRFLAVEFGAERIPDLTRALLAGGGSGEALRVAIRTDPASMPVAFDSFATRIAGDLLDNPFVRELAAVRRLAPAARIPRLSGLAPRAKDPYVAAAILEELGHAEFLTEAWADAADTFSRIERTVAAYAQHLDRDRLEFALCFLRQGEGPAFALRLKSFLAEFPQSGLRARARFELGRYLTGSGRDAEARQQYEALIRESPRSAPATAAALLLAREEMGGFHYAEALGILDRVPSDEKTRALAAEIAKRTAGGLPERAGPEVLRAVRGLSSPDAEKGAAAVSALAAIGPAALESVARPLRADPGRWPLPDYRRRALAVARAWGGDAGRALRELLLGDPWGNVGTEALADLIGAGVDAGVLKGLLRPGTPAARAFADRFGAGGQPAEVRRLLESDDFRDRAAAAGRLAALGDADSLRLLAGLAKDASPQVRRAAATAAGTRPDAGLGAVLDRLAGDDSPLVRIEALNASRVRGEPERIRRLGLSDADARVRVTAAGLLLEGGAAKDVARIVGMLADPDPAVRSGVERLLREGGGPARGPALADALVAAEEPGDAMRIVRVMAHLAGRDFGYDPGGRPAERKRVAEAFRAAWPGEAPKGSGE